MRFSGPKDIKVHVQRFLENNKEVLKGKTVIDLPAGTGLSSQLLKDSGADVRPFDLFPEFFNVPGLDCQRADVTKEIPMEDSTADYVLCQEGIEHFSDQAQVLKEFNRVLRKKGRLLLTTPNYSNLKSRFSYFLSESEYFSKIMPPNEMDSIWMSDQNIHNELYYGHIFLIGIQKLRVLAKLAGFRIKEIHHVRANGTSLLLLPFAYPLIYLFGQMAYRSAMKRTPAALRARKKTLYREQMKINRSMNTLLGSHLFVEFEKEYHSHEVLGQLESRLKGFDVVT